MKRNQCGIHKSRGNASLDHTDHSCLFSGLPQSGKTEFMTNGKSNKAKSNIGKYGQGIHLFKGIETKSRDSEASEYARTNQYAGYKIGGNIR